MSDTDSFIDEVTEEVRRDRLFGYMRRYGWIAVLAILLLVGGAAWNEWQKAQKRNAAEALGDQIVAALALEERGARAEALTKIDATEPSAQAVLDLLAASEAAGETPEDAAKRLMTLAEREGTDPVYRQIATLKAVALPDSGLDVETRRTLMNGLGLSGGLVRLLAEEQLALIDLETGDKDAALERMMQIAADAEATAGLRRRATQVIVALGAEPPELPRLDQPGASVSE
ncbi:tetratricopeptide repeat protein [Roseovarius sp.]|uniref:tetratricopeptide repeat protein n=1 Tax=Roseovarius sp. TaxID=1486281 RepID=UPI0025E7DDD1|nr:tetratricopeptide repeat protein [Roseovarius sp.]